MIQIYISFTFSVGGNLDMMRVRATDPRPCPKCGKIYRSAHTLRTHMEDKHTMCSGYRWIILSNIVKCCQMLSNIVKYCQILSNIVKNCQILSNIVKSCQILSNLVKYCQILSNLFKTILFLISFNLSSPEWIRHMSSVKLILPVHPFQT